MTLRFDVVTLFPEMFSAITEAGITRRALESGLWQLQTWNPRECTTDAHRTVDDRPYGGGPGMVMMAAPLEQSITAAKIARGDEALVVYLSPQGKPLTQKFASDLAKTSGAILLCGRYEGVDERVIERCVDVEVSLGDFVLSGGELAAMALIDACVRQVPGALGDSNSAAEDSFADGLLDCPHYTRPEFYENCVVPEVLLSGDHEKIRRWRLTQALARTATRRPDLLEHRALSQEEAELLAEHRRNCN
ncbi:MAG: tRNA (guanosine(37)-N1)-methyltransferase TrmD [Rhodocyclaceae bacterium]|nr:tRNA (guanosine(37)-N1)-methyltransferase TrmD [Rhodocyclaceae bacterium]